MPQQQRKIVEIAVEVTGNQLFRLKGFMDKALKCKYYIEPDRDYESLSELIEEMEEELGTKHD
jgi:hypothetical protein